MTPEYKPETATIVADCPDCNAVTTFVGQGQNPIGQFVIQGVYELNGKTYRKLHWALFRCSGCTRGGLAEIYTHEANLQAGVLRAFYPRSIEKAQIPKSVPLDITAELREAELCASVGAWRAASALIRSTLEKILKKNGYTKGNLQAKIDAASEDGVLTEARKKRAHSEIRVLGNDVLHDEWREIQQDAVEASHHYCQRILEDFYDDRNSVEEILKTKKRITAADSSEGQPEAGTTQP